MGMVLVGSWALLLSITIAALIIGPKKVRWLLVGCYVGALPFSINEFLKFRPHSGSYELWFLFAYGIDVLRTMFYLVTTLVIGGAIYYFLRWFFYGNKDSR